MTRFLHPFWTAALLLLGSLTVALAAPNAPSNLRGYVTSGTALTLIWNDNSIDETNFEVAVTDNGTANGTITLGFVAGTGTVFLNLSPTAGHTYTFTVRAYITTNTNASAYSNTITIVTNDFNTPNIVAAENQTNGSVLVTWVDNAITEAGYFLEYRTLPSGTFTVAGSTGQNFTGFTLSGLALGTSYEFRVRGFKGTAAIPTATTGYSSTVSVTTPSIAAPTSLVVTPIAPLETSARFSFTDNTTLNNGYELEYALAGSGMFSVFATAGDFSTIDALSLLSPGTAYDFRIRAYYDNGSPRTYSGYSNVASLTTPFSAPTGLITTAVTATQASLSWVDNSQAESGYALYYRVSGSGSYTVYSITAANATTASVAGLSPGVLYDFLVTAFYQRNVPLPATVVESVSSNTLSVRAKDVFTSAAFQPITYGQSFTYQATTTNGSSPTGWNATGLPNGLFLNTTSGTITGSPSQSGLFPVTLTATFSDGWIATKTLTLRVIRPPTAPIAATLLPATLTLTTGQAAASFTLGDKFSDPDVESAVRLATTKGNIDILLYPAETPGTVTNFLGYVNRGDYNNSTFHRISDIASGLVVLQGGQFKPTNAGANTFSEIPLQTAIANEPGISNVSYTIAMAKQGGNPDSATSQFYFNLSDINTALDQSANNGAFTVFGRVSESTKPNLNATATAPPGGPYDISVAGSTINQGFQWPMNVASPANVPATMDNTKIMTIVSATPLTQILAYTANSSNPNVASAAIVSGNLTITPVGPGTTTVTATATDLDGMTASQSITVTVNQTFSSWATSLSLTGANATTSADPDRDGIVNLLEFGFLTLPNSASSAARPSLSTVCVGQTTFAEITFPIRKFAPGLTYKVEATSLLASPTTWSTLWTSSDGLAAPVVTSALNQTDRTVITIRDTQSAPARFLHVVISGS